MKNTVKLILGLVLLISILLSACAPPPPPVTKDQLEQTDAEALEAEKNADELKTEMDTLEEELNRRKAELESIKEYQQELELEE